MQGRVYNSPLHFLDKIKGMTPGLSFYSEIMIELINQRLSTW